MSDSSRDTWTEVGRRIEDFGRMVREHLGSDAVRGPAGPPAPPPASSAAPGAAAPGGTEDRPAWSRPGGTPAAPGDTAPRASGPVGTGPDDGEDPWAAATTGAPIAPAGAAPTGPIGATSDGLGTPPTTSPPADGDDLGDAARPGWADPTGADAGAGPTDAGSDDPRAAGGGRGAWVGGSSWSWTTPDGERHRHEDWRSGGDWDGAREQVRRLGESAQRLAAHAGDAARDPQVRESAQAAARGITDAVTATVAELRERMRSPRWSDPDRPAEQPPVSRTRDDDPA